MYLLGEGSPESNDEKDQEIIVVSPPPKESICLSSGSTPTLPYSHGQADLSSLTPSSSSIDIPSLPIPISQNVTIKHFPLSSFSSNFLYHTSFQPSLTSLPDPPPYPRSILTSPLGSTLQSNLLSSFHPQPTPLIRSNPLVGSSFSFHQPTFFSQPFLNPWPSHPIYHPQPIYATTSHSLSSFSSSSLSAFSTNTFITCSNTIPTFTTTSSIPRPSPSGSSQRRPTRGWQRGWGRCNTCYSSRRPYSQTSDSYTCSFTNVDFSSSNPSWSGLSRYLCPDGPLDLSTRPRFTNYSSGGGGGPS